MSDEPEAGVPDPPQPPRRSLPIGGAAAGVSAAAAAAGASRDDDGNQGVVGAAVSGFAAGFAGGLKQGAYGERSQAHFVGTEPVVGDVVFDPKTIAQRPSKEYGQQLVAQLFESRYAEQRERETATFFREQEKDFERMKELPAFLQSTQARTEVGEFAMRERSRWNNGFERELVDRGLIANRMDLPSENADVLAQRHEIDQLRQGISPTDGTTFAQPGKITFQVRGYDPMGEPSVSGEARYQRARAEEGLDAPEAPAQQKQRSSVYDRHPELIPDGPALLDRHPELRDAPPMPPSVDPGMQMPGPGGR